MSCVRRTIKLIERGVSERRVNVYKIGSEIQCRTKEIQFRQDLKIADVFTAYVVLTLGALLSFVFAVIEKMFHSFQHSRRLHGVQDPTSVSSISATTSSSVKYL